MGRMAGFLVRMKKALAFSANSSACHGSCLIFSYGLQPAWLMFCFSLQWLSAQFLFAEIFGSWLLSYSLCWLIFAVLQPLVAPVHVFQAACVSFLHSAMGGFILDIPFHVSKLPFVGKCDKYSGLTLPLFVLV